MINADDIAAKLEDELSTSRRIQLVLLVVFSLAVSSGVGSLLLTETALPPRTQAAFAAIVAIGLAWTTFGLWALTTRRALYARQRVVATRLALLFGLAYTVGCVALFVAGVPAGGAAGLLGAAMTLVAWWLHRGARQTLDHLIARRHTLEARHEP
jgi:hypothetical protein